MGDEVIVGGSWLLDCSRSTGGNGLSIKNSGRRARTLKVLIASAGRADRKTQTEELFQEAKDTISRRPRSRHHTQVLTPWLLWTKGLVAVPSKRPLPPLSFLRLEIMSERAPKYFRAGR